MSDGDARRADVATDTVPPPRTDRPWSPNRHGLGPGKLFGHVERGLMSAETTASSRIVEHSGSTASCRVGRTLDWRWDWRSRSWAASRQPRPRRSHASGRKRRRPWMPHAGITMDGAMAADIIGTGITATGIIAIGLSGTAGSDRITSLPPTSDFVRHAHRVLCREMGRARQSWSFIRRSERTRDPRGRSLAIPRAVMAAGGGQSALEPDRLSGGPSPSARLHPVRSSRNSTSPIGPARNVSTRHGSTAQ